MDLELRNEDFVKVIMGGFEVGQKVVVREEFLNDSVGVITLLTWDGGINICGEGGDFICGWFHDLEMEHYVEGVTVPVKRIGG